MPGAVVIGTAVAFAAAAALVGHAGGSPPSGPVSPFGGPVPVHIAQVGRIEVALGLPGRAGLRRVPCAGPVAAATACFVAR